MGTNQFNNQWKKYYARLVALVLAVLVVVVVAVTFFKGCTDIGKASREAVYVPSEDEGYVKRANDLLRELVEAGNASNYKVHPHSITELQRRYPALRFALPYDEDAVEGATAADIRLVGIVADSIKDEAHRDFYYNSDLPGLLEKQRSNLGERKFRISFSDSTFLSIQKIEVLPGMFKLALEKDPWVGVVSCAENALFADSNHCFVSWGQSVLPLRLNSHGRARAGYQKVVRMDSLTQAFVTMAGRPIDYYNLYQSYERDSTTLCIRWRGTNAPCVYIDYLSRDSLSIKTQNCICQPYDSDGAMARTSLAKPSMKGHAYPLRNHLKLMVTKSDGKTQVGEFTVSRMNPMLTLSSLVRSNAGLSRHNLPPTLTDKFTQQLIHGLTTTLQNTVYKDTVRLSIDPILSMEMEKELEAYANVLKNKSGFYPDDQWELSLTVMDMATGEVIAAPYYRTVDRQLDYDLALGRKNPALTRRFIGSTFKPLVALAAVLTDHKLDTLSTKGKYRLLSDGKADFLGHVTTSWSDEGSSAGFWNGCTSMERFFAISDDVYPVALVAKALHYGERTDNPFHFDKKRREVALVEQGDFTWANSRFITILDSLYDIPSPREYRAHDSLQMEYYTWEKLKVNSYSRFGLDNVSPDPTLLYYDHFTRPGATLHNELSTWVLGQGTNEWNCLKLAEAWSRMLTKRKVKASLIAGGNAGSPVSLADKFDDKGVWNHLLQSLRKAQSSHEKALLRPMQDAVNQLNRQEQLRDTLLLFGKTGTPDNYKRTEWKSVKGGPRWLDVGLYCMGLMPSSAFSDVQKGKGGRGLMCVVRVTRIVSNKHKTITSNNDKDGIQSRDARNFFSSYPQRLRKFYRLAESHL